MVTKTGSMILRNYDDNGWIKNYMQSWWQRLDQGLHASIMTKTRWSTTWWHTQDQGWQTIFITMTGSKDKCNWDTKDWKKDYVKSCWPWLDQELHAVMTTKARYMITCSQDDKNCIMGFRQ